MGLQSKALFWTLMSGSSTVATSTAVSMLAAEQNGLALDFTDSFFFSRYGLYGSASVKDLTTIANNYNSIPGDLLTDTGTTKLTRQSDGVYRYGPHNLLANSEDFSQSTWTKTATVTSSTTLTDSSTSAIQNVSASVSGVLVGGAYHLRLRVANDGVPSSTRFVMIRFSDGTTRDVCLDTSTGGYKVTAGSFDTVSVTSVGSYWEVALSLTSGGTTLTTTIYPACGTVADISTATVSNYVLTVTGSATVSRVHLRRTPSDSTYLATGASAKYGIPYEWSAAGVLQGALMELQATNLFLNSEAGATQTITVSNATAYVVSFFGTGSITFSGANSSTLNGTGATDRVQTTFTTSSTSLTCTVTGSINYVQVETGTVATSPIITYGASATRTGDLLSLATTKFPYSNGCPMTFHAQLEPPNGVSTYPLVFSSGTLGLRRLNTNIPRLDNSIGGTGHVTYGSPITGIYSQAAATASGDQALCINGGTVSTNSFVYAHTGLTQLNIGALAANNAPVSGYLKKVLWLPRRMSNAELQVLTT